MSKRKDTPSPPNSPLIEVPCSAAPLFLSGLPPITVPYSIYGFLDLSDSDSPDSPDCPDCPDCLRQSESEKKPLALKKGNFKKGKPKRSKKKDGKK